MTTPEYMSIYIADYLEPLIFNLRREGKLTQSSITKKNEETKEVTLEYEGEFWFVDKDNNLSTGFGKLTIDNVLREGMFYKGSIHGISLKYDPQYKLYYEAYKGSAHGKGTAYFIDGKI